MAAVGADAREAGRAAVERRDWNAAYEILSTIEAPDGADLELLSDVALWSRRRQQRLDLLERAADAFLRAGDRHGAARVMFKLAREHWERGDEPVSSGCLKRGATLLEGLPEAAEHATLAWMSARACLNRGDMQGLLDKATEAVDVARRVGNRDVEALATMDLGHAMVAMGRFEEGVALMDEANAAASSGALELQAAGSIYCSTIWSCRNIGDWRRAAAWTDVSLRWCERQRVTGYPGQCRFHRAEVMRMRGHFDEAEVDACSAIEELAAERPIFAGWGHMELGEINRRRGDFAAAERSFQRAFELGTDPQPGWALLRLSLGEVATAKAMIERALAARDIISRGERVQLLPVAVTVALAGDEVDTANALLNELRSLSTSLNTPHATASFLGAEGEFFLGTNRPGEAIQPLIRAWRSWCEAEAPYEAARARTLVGLAHRQVGDEAAAQVELAAALAGFERLGARRDADAVHELLAQTAAGPRPERVRTTFAFVDMVGSTGLVEILGDDAWAELLSWYERTLQTAVTDHGGSVVKQGGDGFFVVFDEAPAALAWAVDLQQLLARHRREHGFAPRVRIGLHTTEAHRRGEDYAGLGVHAAARIGSSAAADEILASGTTIDHTRSTPNAWPATENPRTLSLRGISEPVDVATVTWR